jgi:hypothetical protein
MGKAGRRWRGPHGVTFSLIDAMRSLAERSCAENRENQLQTANAGG